MGYKSITRIISPGILVEQDNESLDHEDYPSRAIRVVRALRQLAECGGYVCAQYHDHDDYLVGKVAARYTNTSFFVAHGAVDVAMTVAPLFR